MKISDKIKLRFFLKKEVLYFTSLTYKIQKIFQRFFLFLFMIEFLKSLLQNNIKGGTF